MFYYAPSSDRGDAGGALVFLGMFCTVHSATTFDYVTIVTTVTTSTKVTTSTIVD